MCDISYMLCILLHLNSLVGSESKCIVDTVKPLKIDNMNAFKTDGCLVYVESIAECSTPLLHSAKLLTRIKRLSVLNTYLSIFD